MTVNTDALTARDPALPGKGVFVSIQALRAVAALLVTIFHAGLRSDPTESTFRIGNAGVDIFFVISGFVMWTVTARRPTSPQVFLTHRILRLVPLYWLATFAMVAGALALPSAFPRLQFSASDVILSLAFVPHISAGGGGVPVVGQGWTLNFEMFFYLLFACVLALPAAWRLRAIACLLVGLPVLASLLPGKLPAAARLLDPLLIEFLGGICIARWAVRGLPTLLCWSGGVVGIVLLLFASPAADDDLARTAQYGVPALLIVGSAVGLESAGQLRIGRLLVLLGDSSYSLYLSHTFVISLLGKLWRIETAPWVFMAVAVIVSMAVGVAVYRLVEQPLLALTRRRPRPALSASTAD